MSNQGLVERLREYTAFRYAGDCKCGKCRLVPREVIDETMAAIATLTQELAEARKALRFYATEWLGCTPHGLDVEYEPTQRLLDDHGDLADAAISSLGEVRTALSSSASPTAGEVELSAEEMREAAALLCENLRNPDFNSETEDWVAGTIACAKAIRSMSGPLTKPEGK